MWFMLLHHLEPYMSALLLTVVPVDEPSTKFSSLANVCSPPQPYLIREYLLL